MGASIDLNTYMGKVNAINPVGNPYMASASTMFGMNPMMNPMMMGGFNPMFGGGMMGGMMNPMMMGGGANNYQNFKDTADMKGYANARMDEAQVGIYSNGQGRISQKAYMIAKQLQGALAAGNETEAGNILKSVEGDKIETAGIERAYDQMTGKRCSLRNDIRNDLGGSKSFEGIAGFIHKLELAIVKPFNYNPMSQREAIDILNQGAEVDTTVAANALKDATLGFGTDERTINNVLGNSNGRMAEINASYQQMGCNLSEDIRGDFHSLLDGPGTEERINGRIINELA